MRTRGTAGFRGVEGRGIVRNIKECEGVIFMKKLLRCGAQNKFIVIKREDASNFLTRVQRDILLRILKTITSSRLKKGKKIDNEYLVINTDEPYANEVIDIKA
jgi:hypothetical protein